MMLLTLMGGPIGRLVRRVMLSLVPPAGRINPNVPPDDLRFPFF